MLRMLRSRDGSPAPHMRVIASVIVIGMLVLAAPVLIPVLHWLYQAFWF